MKARLVKDPKGNVKLLYKDGSIGNGSTPLLANFILNFKNIEHESGIDGNWRNDAVDMAFYPGETIAIVTDDLELILYSGEVFTECVESSMQLGAYISTIEYAALHGKSPEIIKVLCRQNRIRGCQKKGRNWMIPRDAPYPVPTKRQRPKSCGPKTAEE